MIGEAIDALSENGGSAEDSISAFIRTRYPGVPAAHDRLLRHYLAKHVSEGFFVRGAHGRYARCPDEAAVVEVPVEQAGVGSSEAARVGTPVTEPKRGRGRPRKDGSSSTSPAGKKDGSAGPRSATSKRRGQHRDAAPPAADEGSVPTSSVAVDKDGNQATSSTPRRSRRLLKVALATTTDGSGEALLTDKKNDVEAPSTTDNEHGRPLELALVIVGDGSATTSIVDNVCGEASSATPVDRGQPRELALVTATDLPAPTPPVDKDGGGTPSFNLVLVAKHDGISATPTAPERGSQSRELALVAAAGSSVPVLVADKDGGEAPSASYKRRRQPPRKAAPKSTADKKVGRKALSVTPKGRRRQRKQALMTAGNCSAPTPAAVKKAGREVSFATPKLTPGTAGGGSNPTSVTDKDGDEAPAVALKQRSRPSKPCPATADEIPDDPLFCLLALPACMPAAATV
uniref:H15 domain-containing protein n=1 Tax=Arundo donax TaxID=35708 RepID=A0A0A9GT01_ARUDO